MSRNVIQKVQDYVKTNPRSKHKVEKQTEAVVYAVLVMCVYELHARDITKRVML